MHVKVFAEEYIHEIFWNNLRFLIDEELERYRLDNQKIQILTITLHKMHGVNFRIERNIPISIHIDTYIWGFLYDIYIKGYYLEKKPLGTDPLITIKKYF